MTMIMINTTATRTNDDDNVDDASKNRRLYIYIGKKQEERGRTISMTKEKSTQLDFLNYNTWNSFFFLEDD